jgi:hypothetical protein
LFKIHKMEIKRTFTDDTNSKIEIKFTISDDEIIDLISKKSVDERIVFFRKLFQTDLKNVLTFNFLKQFL